MLEVSATLIGTTPISFSAPIRTVKEVGEDHNAFEERTWRERLHVDPKTGFAMIPPPCLKGALSGVAKYLQESVPGKRMATYTKYFEAGIIVTEPMILLDGKGKPIKPEDVAGERLFCAADGVRGGSKKVWKTFPTITDWQTIARFLIIDPILVGNVAKVQEYLEHSGKFVGIGRMRPIRGGYYGRWEVSGFKAINLDAKRKSA